MGRPDRALAAAGLLVGLGFGLVLPDPDPAPWIVGCLCLVGVWIVLTVWRPANNEEESPQ